MQYDSSLFIQPYDDETEIDETILEIPVPIRSLSTHRNRRSKTRSYKFIQLERALTAAHLLKTNDERLLFENEYLHAIHHRTFDQFAEKYYRKIRDHTEQIKQEQTAKQTRVFSFVDLERNFLALDPSRDVKIIFLDEPSPSTRTKSAHQRTTSAMIDNETAVETFYAKRAEVLLDNPALAREEISLFARRRAERLHERLPRLTSVPHRVKIIDQRDMSGQPDERTLLQMKHKRALSTINQRRHVIMKMINQAKKNQIKMDELWNQPTVSIDSSACCRELLERANQIDEDVPQRPRTAISSRKRIKQTTSSISGTLSNTMTRTGNSACSSSSSTVPFQDALSVDQMEKTKTVRVLIPTRPLTAPTRANWINYC